MNILCWNCRGLGNPQTVQELGDLIWAQDSLVVFLAETWLDKARLEETKVCYKFKGLIEVSRISRGGGVAMFWKEGCNLSLDTYSPNHIDVIINKGKDDEWRFTGFYGEPDTRNRDESWEKLRRLKNKFTLPWLCAGDFNEILKADEKLGGRSRPTRQMEAFREVIAECGFKDLGYVGGKYTWYRGSRGGNTIWERLDRAVATTDWIEKFPATKVVHLKCGSSDHKPIIILPKGVQIKKKKPWRFEQMWLEDEGCGEVVDLVWRRIYPGNSMAQVEGKIKGCQAKLRQWS